MRIEDFDYHVRDKARAYDPKRDGIPEPVYGALALCGEAGELAGKVKKIWRDKAGKLTDEIARAVLDELGDCLWYLTYIAHAFGFTLQDVMLRNIEKLNDRARRGVQLGDGDNR